MCRGPDQLGLLPVQFQTQLVQDRLLTCQGLRGWSLMKHRLRASITVRMEPATPNARSKALADVQAPKSLSKSHAKRIEGYG